MSQSSSDIGTCRVAILGLGIIGSRAADRLVAAGYQTARWNRTPKHHPDERASAADAAADADVVILYLKDATAVQQWHLASYPH